MKSRFSDEQIITKQEASERTADVCRRHGVSMGTVYKWKAKFDGMELSEAKRLRTLEIGKAKLKELLAEQMFDKAILKDIASKKW